MMQTNFSSYLGSLQERKQNLLALANKAIENGWIPQNKTANKNLISLEEIKEKLDKDTLTIGVIGQMKCGKSTFLNAFIFEDDVLPAATTPMTAALSVITYGEEKKIVAEFYTADEWAEQQQQASRSLEDVTGNSLEESKIKAAKELVAKSNKLSSSLNSLLGTTKEDTFDNLIEYVGADGKYISITKSVTIYYPKEYLKGVEIVDTPGFNDPIVSREERTKAFLKKADVVLMMLYAGRPFDATDRDIIFENVRYCGIGKVLIGINKYDIPFCDKDKPENESIIKDYVKAELRKACKECNDDTLVEILKEVEPIPLSAEMALLAELPMSKIAQSEALDFAWKRHCDGFGIGSQPEMRKWSHIDDLVTAVKDLVEKEKEKILFSKPLNAISAAGDKVMSDNVIELERVQSKIKNLALPDDELAEQSAELNKAHNKVSDEIEYLNAEIQYQLRPIIKKGKEDLETTVDAACQKLFSYVENKYGWFTRYKNIEPTLKRNLQHLATHDLKKATANIATKAEKQINTCVDNFLPEVKDEIINLFSEELYKKLERYTRHKIQLEIADGNLFKPASLLGYNNITSISDFFITLIARTYFDRDKSKSNVLNWINSISANFDPAPYLQNALSRKDEIIELVKQAFITELIEPLQEQIQEIRSKQDQKDKLLAEAKQKRQDLEAKKQEIQVQYDELVQMRMEYFGK